jgi:hypothetical protein
MAAASRTGCASRSRCSARCARPGRRDRPMSVRISANDWMGDLGVTPDEAVEIGRAFAEAGADLIDVSAGQTWADCQPVYGRMFQTPFADQIRNEAGSRPWRSATSTSPTTSTRSSPPAAPTSSPGPPAPRRPDVDPARRRRAGLSRSPRAAALSRRHGPARAQPRARSGAQGMRRALTRALRPARPLTGGGTGIGAAIALQGSEGPARAWEGEGE